MEMETKEEINLVPKRGSGYRWLGKIHACTSLDYKLRSRIIDTRSRGRIQFPREMFAVLSIECGPIFACISVKLGQDNRLGTASLITPNNSLV
jgi:hypothetical protein